MRISYRPSDGADLMAGVHSILLILNATNLIFITYGVSFTWRATHLNVCRTAIVFKHSPSLQILRASSGISESDIDAMAAISIFQTL